MKFAPRRMDHYHLYVSDQPGLRQVYMLTLPYHVVIQVTLVQIDPTSIQKHLTNPRNPGFATKPTRLIPLHPYFLDFLYLEHAKT